MYNERMMHWLFGQTGSTLPDSSSTQHHVDSHSCEPCSPSQVQADASGICSTVMGLRWLLQASNSDVLATAFGAGLISAEADAWKGTRGDAASSSSGSSSTSSSHWTLRASHYLKKRRTQQQLQVPPFAAPAAQASLVKQLAAAYEGNSSTANSSSVVSRRQSTDSLSDTGSEADAAVLVTVAAAKLEPVPSIKTLLQRWESITQPSAGGQLSRSDSSATSGSSSSSSSSKSVVSSRYEPTRPCLRPLTAAATGRIQPAAAAAAATDCSSSSSSSSSSDCEEAPCQEVQSDAVTETANVPTKMARLAATAHWNHLLPAAAVASALGLVVASRLR